MSHRTLFIVITLLGLTLLAATILARTTAADATKYVCPPCGLPCDGAVYDKPGACPKCGMTLVDQASIRAAAPGPKVGILIFDGVQVIDYTGPYEIFQAAGFDVFTVAASRDPITTVAGMTVVPKFTFADAPAPDVLVVPGGGIRSALDSEATVRWVRETAGRAGHTMSVCNGAFILAKTGLLDGLSATTTFGNIPKLRSAYPGVRVVDDKRVVDNGKILTTGGLTAGIDGALHVVSLLNGRGSAQLVAIGEEYDWKPGGGFVRGSLAEANLQPWIDGSIDGTGQWKVLRWEGGSDRWEIAAEGASELSPGELVERFDKVAATSGKWKRTDAGSAKAQAASSGHWAFTGRDGKPWRGTLTVRPQASAKGVYDVALTISRVHS